MTRGISKLKASGMPTDYPTVEQNPSFGVVITEAPANDGYTFGTSWGGATPAQNYTIPAGTVISTTYFDFNGGTGSYAAPVLYVAGKLTMESENLGQTTLAILPGGEVVINSLTAQNKGTTQRPAIYIFEGGKLSAGSANLSCRAVVNSGTFAIKGKLDLNNQLEFYNTASATLQANDMEYSNSGSIFNDGAVVLEELKFNSSTSFENFENGVLTIGKCEMESGNRFYQRGKAVVDHLESRGHFYVLCDTYIGEIDAETAKFSLATGACLESVDVEFNNTHVDLSTGSLFIMKSFEAGDKVNNRFENKEKDNNLLPAVIRIMKQAECDKTTFTGPIEIAYNAEGLDDDYQISDKYVKKGAYVTPEQIVNLPTTECNGGKGTITPEPEPDPDYNDIVGPTYTYCFEDCWPFLNDYDLNDIVIETSVGKRTNKIGDKVQFVTINWELRASGAAYDIALAVELDNVRAGEIASIVTSNTTFGNGPFHSATTPEAGNEFAVIPLFNSARAVLSSYNTWKNHPVTPTVKHQTVITFVQPVDYKAVQESVLNYFLVINVTNTGVKLRDKEIHLPGFAPTVFAKVDGYSTVLASNPYKFYTAVGDQRANNGMMWGLAVPGKFNYPAEGGECDIRKTYKFFNEWVSSGGGAHMTWYEEESDAQRVF